MQRSVGHFSAGKVVAHVLEAKMLAFVAADSLCNTLYAPKLCQIADILSSILVEISRVQSTAT